MKPHGQYMLEETAHKFKCWKSNFFPVAGGGILVFKCDFAIINGQDSVIGNSDGAQIN
jgi:hypothetical protein